jgi:hypothetical protein
VVGAVLLYFAHEAIMIVYGGAALFFAVLHPLELRKTSLRLVPFAAAFGIAVAQSQYQKLFMTPTVAQKPTTWADLSYKLARLPDMLIHSTDQAIAALFAALFVGAIAALLVFRWRERRAAGDAKLPCRPLSYGAVLRPRLHRYRFELFALACFVAFLVFPFSLNGATLVYHRFFAPAYVVFVAVAAPKDLSVARARILPICLCLLPVATLLMTWPSFALADKAYRALDRLLPQIEEGSAVAELTVGVGNPARDFSLGTASGRVVAVRGGRVLYGFTDSPISACVIPPEYQWQKPLLRTFNDPTAFFPAYDFTRFRYALVRGTDNRSAEIADLALLPYARVIDRAFEWTLYESRVPTVPLLSPDDGPEKEEAHPNLWDLMTVMDARQRGLLVPQADPLAVPGHPE